MDFNWPLINDNITEGDKRAVIDFLSKEGVRLTQGNKVREFEKAWSDWLGVKYSIFVNSGASANYIMTAIARDINGIGEVIVPPLGWVSDIAPIVNLGMTPVFVDIDMRSLAITAENIERAITRDTKAIVLVHALGFNGLSEEILRLAEKYDVMLIEDCCESHGVQFGDNKVGTFGDMSNFSFYFGHHITTIEGGMVCTNNDDLYDLAKMYRSHGMTRDASESVKKRYEKENPDLNPLFTFAVPGFNLRSTEINAVIGLEQLPRLDDIIKRRTGNLEVWLENLRDDIFYTDFDLDGSSNFSLPLILRGGDHKLFSKIGQHLTDKRIEFRKGTAGGGNQVKQPYLSCYPHRISGNLTNVNQVHDFGLYVGNHTDLRQEQIATLAQQVSKIN
jgi:CDP-6-deoxy-D-xylo-4-hexulose-3-dehydrase|tara:strand:+ start:3139 stop:4308 length:1170 start_codon:yes stop_codon:yes gene_type:complete